jgi:hypothetical protein
MNRLGVIVVCLVLHRIEPGRGHERMMNDSECFHCVNPLDRQSLEFTGFIQKTVVPM